MPKKRPEYTVSSKVMNNPPYATIEAALLDIVPLLAQAIRQGKELCMDASIASPAQHPTPAPSLRGEMQPE